LIKVEKTKERIELEPILHRVIGHSYTSDIEAIANVSNATISVSKKESVIKVKVRRKSLYKCTDQSNRDLNGK
jgi:hypothetical protein